jgi:hypothetical protein
MPANCSEYEVVKIGVNPPNPRSNLGLLPPRLMPTCIRTPLPLY